MAGVDEADASDARISGPVWSEFFADKPQDRLRVFDWSVSGFETCVAVQGQGFRLALDIGACPPQAISADFVFVSHGHVDHCGAIHQHMRRRQLVGLPPATYYVPEHLVQPLGEIVRLFDTVHGDAADETGDECRGKRGGKDGGGGSFHGNIVAAVPGEEIALSKKVKLRPFATDHRVPSIGCVLLCRRSHLLAEYHGRPGPELEALARSGASLRESRWEATLAYTGDTRFSVFACPPDPDLLRVRLLVCELTYIDGPTDRAEQFGHCHLHDFSSRAGLFDQVGQLLFVHFSRRYAPDRLLKEVLASLPEGLRARVHCGLNGLRAYQTNMRG